MGLTHSDDSPEDVLIYAIKKNNTKKIRSILKKGAKVNYRDACGFTPLMHAAISGNTETVEMLLKAGSNIKDKNYKGLDALVLAKFNGNTNVYNLLIDKKADESIIETLRLSNMPLVDGCKYSYIDIIKKEIYCEDDSARELIDNMLNIIERYKDDRVELIMLSVALYTMEKDWTHNNLQIFVTSNIDVSVFKGYSLSTGYLLGSYSIEKNIIQTSNFGGEFIAAQTFLHELVHKVHFACKHLRLSKLECAYREVEKRLNQLASSRGKDYIKRNLVNRVGSIPDYGKNSLKMLEYLADPIAYTLSCNKSSDMDGFVLPMQYILQPIYYVFDTYIAVELMEYAMHNKNFQKLMLSDAMRYKLIDYMHKRDSVSFIPRVEGSKNILCTNGKQLK